MSGQYAVALGLFTNDHFFPVGDPNATELVQIQSGQLYLVRSESVKASRECM